MQHGTLRLVGKSWFGYFNVWVFDEKTGERVRRQRCVKLGSQTKLKRKWQAMQLLSQEIERTLGPAGDAKPTGADTTLESFIKTRWLPLKEGRWRKGTRAAADHVLSHIVKEFGATPLDRLDRVLMQVWLNKLAQTHSDSVVKHARIFLKSICAEALDEEYIRKNPAAKLELPHTRVVSKSALTVEQFKAVLKELKPPFDLMIRVALITAMRPSELLALRWCDLDIEAKQFLIRETVYRGELRPYTKTTREGSEEAHLLTVAIPDALVDELVAWRGEVNWGWGTRDWSQVDDFIFATKRGTFYTKDNILARVFAPIRKKLKLPTLNFQVLRRTMATISQHHGSLKDSQTHLRHRKADTTANVYVQPIAETTRAMVNSVYDVVTQVPK